MGGEITVVRIVTISVLPNLNKRHFAEILID